MARVTRIRPERGDDASRISAGGPSEAPPIPAVDLAAQHARIRPDLDHAIAGVLDHTRFVLGPEVAAFEGQLASYAGFDHAIGCASGSDALWLALRALGVPRGSQVLCPGYSFFATGSAIVHAGAEPVFADIDPATFNLDPDSARRAAKQAPRLAAILSADLFGVASDQPALAGLANELGVPLVCDIAQAIGARDDQGRPVGTLGKIASLSLYPTKNLGAIGDGGAVLTSDPGLADRVRRLRVHGEGDAGLHPDLGINSRLDTLQAAVLSVKLRHLDGWIEERTAHAAHYARLFAALGARPLGEPFASDGLPLAYPTPAVAPARHVHHRQVVRVPAPLRDGLVASLRMQGIGCEVYYRHGLHEQPSLAAWAPAGGLPGCEAAARESVTLPLYPELRPGDIERVAAACAAYLRGAERA